MPFDKFRKSYQRARRIYRHIHPLKLLWMMLCDFRDFENCECWFHFFFPPKHRLYLDATSGAYFDGKKIYRWHKSHTFRNLCWYLATNWLCILKRIIREEAQWWELKGLFARPRFSVGAIAFDAVSSSTGTTTSISVSHTTSGSNRVLVGTAAMRDDAVAYSITGMTYAGTSLTDVVNEKSSAGAGYTEADGKRLVAPATGANTFEVTFSANPTQGSAIGCVSFTGADQTTPIDASGGGSISTGSSTLEITVTTLTDNAFGVYACCTQLGTNNPNTLTVGGSATERWNLIAVPNESRCAGSTLQAGAAGPFSMSYSRSTSNFDMSAILIAVRELKPPSIHLQKLTLGVG